MTLTAPTTQSPLEDLTPAEVGIVHLLAEGLTNREIGARRFISEHTVKYHLGHIFQKLGARNRVEAAITYHVWATG